MTIVYFNGKFLPEMEAKISATSFGALFGEGVFTTILVEEGQVLFWHEHLSRLKDHATELKIEPFSISLDDVKTLMSKNNVNKGRWRLRITLFSRQSPYRCLEENQTAFEGISNLKPYDLLMSLTPISDNCKSFVSLCVYPQIISSPYSKIKTLNYLNRFYLKDYALKMGFDDSLSIGPENKILEASFSNIFWIEKDRVFIPDRSLPYFFGLTLEHILKSLIKDGYKVNEGFYELSDIPSTAGVYLCSSVMKIIPVTQIEEREFNQSLIEIDFLS